MLIMHGIPSIDTDDQRQPLNMPYSPVVSPLLNRPLPKTPYFLVNNSISICIYHRLRISLRLPLPSDIVNIPPDNITHHMQHYGFPAAKLGSANVS